MLVRALISLFFLAVAAGCHNEPYETPTLVVTSLFDKSTTPKTLSFTYSSHKLHTFLSRTSTDTLSAMIFEFDHDVLKSITSDTTVSSFKRTTFYYFSDNTVDTTYYFGKDTTLVSARTVTYDAERNPVTVLLQTYTGGVLNAELAELTWENGNVIRLITSNVTTGGKTNVKDIIITTDDQFSVYPNKPEFLYTLPLTELYWLSKNNPITFDDGTGAKEYIYWYNKFGYPTNFQTDTGLIYGASYTQER